MLPGRGHRHDLAGLGRGRQPIAAAGQLAGQFGPARKGQARRVQDHHRAAAAEIAPDTPHLPIFQVHFSRQQDQAVAAVQFQRRGPQVLDRQRRTIAIAGGALPQLLGNEPRQQSLRAPPGGGQQADAPRLRLQKLLACRPADLAARLPGRGPGRNPNGGMGRVHEEAAAGERFRHGAVHYFPHGGRCRWFRTAAGEDSPKGPPVVPKRKSWRPEATVHGPED